MAIMTSLASFLLILLLAAAVCTHGEESVRDSNGNEVRLKEQYYIQPISNGINGGSLAPLAGNHVVLAKHLRENRECQLALHIHRGSSRH
ncbi:unnamed protein product [Brassica oleracea]